MQARSGFVAGASAPYFACIGLGLLLSSTAFPLSARSQVLPDNTLGTEGSVITPIDLLSDRIDGGALRGTNLFHSFLEFNVGDGRGIYFANPTGIENILTRITGSNASNIFGTLGVLGNANLFLINPNGIYFGPNARLDVSGSFLATTADGIQLGNNGYFSATDPQGSQLLSVQPQALFANALRNHQAQINNRGNLSVGGNLTLVSDELDLQGQLAAGGNLTLVGVNLVNSPWNLQTNSQQNPSSQGTVRIRDSATSPFIAAAGGELLLQGNGEVDIFALNHPDSGLYSGGDMVLRGGNPVGGDAHYYTGGSFRIEQLNGSVGDLFSPYDPVIRALGDVNMGSYVGASLHILAGGRVNIGSVVITGTDSVGNSINPTNTPDLATVTLSNGQVVTINGNARPTLDVRAGMNPGDIGIPGITGTVFPNPTLSPTATGSDITIGSISISFLFLPLSDGLIFLTNQFRPNPNLPPGTIQIANDPNNILFGNTPVSPGTGGDVIIDSRAAIVVDRTIDADAAGILAIPLGDGGDVTMLARDNISLTPSSQGNSITVGGLVGGNIRLESDRDIVIRGGILSFSSSGSNTSATGGDITIRARNLSLTDRGVILGSTQGAVNAGAIDIEVSQSLTADGESTLGLPSGIYSFAPSNATGHLGDIRVAANTISLINGTQISSLGLGGVNSGNVEIVATESFAADGEGRLGLGGGVYNTTVNGNSGNIDIRTRSFNLTNGAVVKSESTGQGSTGNIEIAATQSFTADGEGSRPDLVSGIYNNTVNGNGGEIDIRTSSFQLTNGAKIDSTASGQGNSSNIEISATQSFVADGEGSLGLGSGIYSITANGNGGAIAVQTGSLQLTDGGAINSISGGNSSNIEITATESFIADGNSSSGQVSGINSLIANGNGGAIDIRTSSFQATNGAGISLIAAGQGSTGNIEVVATERFIADGEGSLGQVSGISSNTVNGNVGAIAVQTGSFQLSDGARISSNSFGAGSTGNIEVAATQSFSADGESSSAQPSGIYGTTINGNVGAIGVQTGSFQLSNGASINATAGGSGNTGNIEIAATQNFTANGEGSSGQGSGIYSTTFNGNGGEIDIQTPSLNLNNGAFIGSIAGGEGNASKIEIVASENFTASGAGSAPLGGGIFSFAANGNGEDIDIRTRSFKLTDGNQINSTVVGRGNSSNIQIIATENFTADGVNPLGVPSGVFSNLANGNGGSLNIQTGSLNLTGGATLSTRTNGAGNAGAVDVEVARAFNADGESRQGQTQGASSEISSFALPGATGNTGNLRVRTGSLNLTNGAALRTITNSSGNAGAVDVAVSQTLNADGESSLGLSSGISSLALPNATGSTGELRVGANALNLTNGAGISSVSLGQGSTSNIEIAVADRFSADGATSLGELGGVFSVTRNGAAGDIGIQANSVKLTNGAKLSSSAISPVILSSFASANPSIVAGVDNSSPLTRASSGNISIRATQTFEADGASPSGVPSSVSTTLSPGVEGRAGDINISTNALRFTNGAKLDTSTAGRGNAGQISIVATDSVVFEGITPTGNSSGGISSLVAPGAIGNGGRVSITTGSLAVLNGAVLNTVTLGQGNGGNFDIKATGSVLVDGESQILTSSLPGAIGNSGRIDLSAGTITLSNRGFISTFASGQGNAGDIDLRAGSLTLQNQSSIDTESFSGSGGNINLGIQGQLLMRYESIISTSAGFLGSGGDGGNINIAADYIIGVPTENSDITANAFTGSGGQIRITTNGIYGLSFRPRLTPLSDITASSEFGVDGTFDLNRLSFPAEQGLNQLPTSPIDAESAFARDVCAIENGKIAGGSSLTITGGGGLPTNPLEPLTPLNGVVEWSSRGAMLAPGEGETGRGGDGEMGSRGAGEIDENAGRGGFSEQTLAQNDNLSTKPAQPPVVVRSRSPEEADENGHPKEILQAQGWVVQPDGSVILTAEVPTVTAYSSGFDRPDCRAL